MSRVGLYLSGAGSLDGSDVFSVVLTYKLLQGKDHEPVPVARDVEQGRIINHRTAAEQDEDRRNSLDESARLVRGNIRDMREVNAESLAAAVLVGGGGTLYTWTDYYERGADCRVTERLKFHVLDLYRADRPILCLDNAFLAVALILRDVTDSLTVNPGDFPELKNTVSEWGVNVSTSTPCWDSDNKVGSLPDLTTDHDLVDLERRIDQLLEFGFSSAF